MEKTFTTQRENILHKQVCCPKDLSIDDLTKQIQIFEPSGTSHGWQYNEKLGEIECAEDPTKKHVCFVC